MTEVERVKIKGGEAIFWGSPGESCGVSIVGTDDLGERGSIEFEVYSCEDLGIRRSGRNWFMTLANFDPEEVVKVLIKGIRRCGCKIKVE